MAEKFDFSGWATRNDLKCSDGRTIRKDAFAHCDGKTVPLVWNHQHNEVDNVLGHALLENREDGVYAYGTFNNTPAGINAKEMVHNGDIKALSIYANQLKQNGMDVLHGAIREVSLVLAGANPGAFIDNIAIAHGEYSDEEAVIYTGEELSLSHSDEEPEQKEEPEENEDKNDNDAPVEGSKSENDDEIQHSDNEETIGDVIDSMNEKQQKVLKALVAQAAKGNKDDKDNSEEGKESMKQNVFEQDNAENTLYHDGLQAIVKDGKRFGSLKESYLAHAEEYGIKDIEWLFPDAKNLSDKPGFIKRNPDAWVDIVMNGVHHTPFSRIKMMFADLREDDARANGYAQKGKLKKEEVFGLIKRTVEPTTIYKKQKLDRDDVIDITDFDVVAWLKAEMRMMLDEEIARAILFGDGRAASSDDKISETNIIPIAKDAALYTIHQAVTPKSGETFGHAFIDAAVIGQDDYEGSGNTKCFMSNKTLTQLLLLEDGDGRRMYKDVRDVALAMSVNAIVKVPASVIPAGIHAIIVDLADYNVGADKGGAVSMFDDFDIDYNQQKYLIETRCSGALTKPFSAVVLETAQAAG